MEYNTEPPKPTQDDAALFLQLYEVYQTDRIAKAVLWYYEFFGGTSAGTADFDGFLQKNPRGTEGYFRWTPLASFFETVGVLVRNELLSEAIVFDRWPVELYWNNLKRFVLEDRDRGTECDTAWYADNFEWLASRALEWRRAGYGKAEWRFGPRKGGNVSI